MIRRGVDCTQEHDGDDLCYIREFHILMRDLSKRCKETFLRDDWGILFAKELPCLVHHDELSFDGQIVQERVLCHSLESPPRVPVPAAYGPLEMDQ